MPYLIVATPRAGRWNHRTLVPPGLKENQVERISRCIAEARDQLNGKEWLAVSRMVKQSQGGREGQELLILADVDTEKLSPKIKKEILQRLENDFDDLERLILHGIDWDTEGRDDPVKRPELAQWYLRGYDGFTLEPSRSSSVKEIPEKPKTYWPYVIGATTMLAILIASAVFLNGGGSQTSSEQPTKTDIVLKQEDCDLFKKNYPCDSELAGLINLVRDISPKDFKNEIHQLDKEKLKLLEPLISQYKGSGENNGLVNSEGISPELFLGKELNENKELMANIYWKKRDSVGWEEFNPKPVTLKEYIDIKKFSGAVMVASKSLNECSKVKSKEQTTDPDPTAAVVNEELIKLKQFLDEDLKNLHLGVVNYLMVNKKCKEYNDQWPIAQRVHESCYGNKPNDWDDVKKGAFKCVIETFELIEKIVYPPLDESQPKNNSQNTPPSSK